MITAHHKIASSTFSKLTLRKLAKQGLFIVWASWIPGADGSFVNGESAYHMSDGKLLPFLAVLALA